MDTGLAVLLSLSHERVTRGHRRRGCGRSRVRVVGVRARPGRRPRADHGLVRRARADARLVVHRHRPLRAVAAAGPIDRPADDGHRLHVVHRRAARVRLGVGLHGRARALRRCGRRVRAPARRVPDRPRRARARALARAAGLRVRAAGAGVRGCSWLSRRRSAPTCPANELLVSDSAAASTRRAVGARRRSRRCCSAGVLPRARAALARVGPVQRAALTPVVWTGAADRASPASRA